MTMSASQAHTPTANSAQKSNTQVIKIVVGSLMLLAAIIIYGSAQWRPGPKVDKALHETIGQVMAQEAGKLAAPGRGVTVITFDTAVFPNPAIDAQMRGFYEAANKTKLKITATNAYQVNPLVVRVPPGDYFEILRKRGEGDLVISFPGPPVFSDAQKAKLGNKKVRIVALCQPDLLRTVPLKQLFAENRLHAGIVCRPVPLSPNAAQDARAEFDRLYQVVTEVTLSGGTGEKEGQ